MVPMSLSTFRRKPPILSWGAQKLTLPVTGSMVLIRLSSLSFLQQGGDYIEEWSRAVALRYHSVMSWVIINPLIITATMGQPMEL